MTTRILRAVMAAVGSSVVLATALACIYEPPSRGPFEAPLQRVQTTGSAVQLVTIVMPAAERNAYAAQADRVTFEFGPPSYLRADGGAPQAERARVQISPVVAGMLPAESEYVLGSTTTVTVANSFSQCAAGADCTVTYRVQISRLGAVASGPAANVPFRVSPPDPRAGGAYVVRFQ